MALRIEIPGQRTLELAHLVLDVNGTLACDGVLEPGAAERREPALSAPGRARAIAWHRRPLARPTGDPV